MAQCLNMVLVRPRPGKPKLFRGQPIVFPPSPSQWVACGKCAFCLQNKRSQWMFRVHHEMRTQEYKGWFLTLTYDEKHVKRVDDGRLSLRFRDVQLFLKMVRKHKYYAKYICVGEYGGLTKRPHYHMLIWTNASPEALETLWFRGKIHFGRLTMASAMYTLKYIIQPKVTGDSGLEKTRAQFSKGIGVGYLSSAVYEYHTQRYEEPVIWSYIDGKKVSLPRYYRNKIFTKEQMRKEGQKAKWEAVREYRKIMRECIAKGIQDSKTYIKGLRADRAAQIISTTKFNQSL